MMEKIPTAKEFYSLEYQLLTFGRSMNQHESMVTFAKLHVQAALKAAAASAKAVERPNDYGTGLIWVDKQSVIEAYPLENIK